MAIPTYDQIMLPLLRWAAEYGEEIQVRQSVEAMAAHYSLSDEERTQLLPSGQQALLDNRVGWARTYLKKAGLIDSPKRGFFRVTAQGLELLKEPLDKLDKNLLKRFESFRNFTDVEKSELDVVVQAQGSATPEDLLAASYKEIRSGLEFDLLDQVKQVSPAFFEQLVVDLLVAMGYGGNRADAAQAIGRSGDGGIDGVINEDRLGLDVIYIQAKRWEGNVGRPEIQKFAGALQGQRARKGVFITTSAFTKDAQEYASFIDSRIILIDGVRLVGLMAEHNVGVSVVGTYEIKRIDQDYFE
jgi:restriction system protein